MRVNADRIVAEIAARQHGVVSRKQLLQAGVPAHVVERRMAAGRLITVHAGVYRVAGHPPSPHQTLMAAVLSGGEGAAVSHRGAAFLLGLADVKAAAEISVPVPRVPRMGGGVLVHRVACLDPVDLCALEGIPTTRPARTLVDLAGVVGRDTLEAALDDALSRRLITVQYLSRRLETLGRQGRAGAGILAGLLAQRADGRPLTTSEFERRLLRAILAAGLPAPVSQFEVRLPTGRRAFLDFAYPEALLGMEADSYRHHSSRTDWARDRTRNRALTAIGWRILPVTWEDLVPDADDFLELLAGSLSEIPRWAG